VRPVLIVREGVILDPGEAGSMKVNDYAYYLAPTLRLGRLDRFFAIDGSAPESDTISEFPFDGGLKVGTIADLYGLDVGPEERDMTVAELFAERLDGTPQENDRIELGDAHLVAHRVAEERVRLAGLLLEAGPDYEDAERDKKPWWKRARARMARLRT
jgi:cell volume regulation protein A